MTLGSLVRRATPRRPGQRRRLRTEPRVAGWPALSMLERDGGTGDIPGQARPRGDAQGRGDHGRGHARAGEIAEDAGAVAVMALERVPADIRRTAASRGWPPSMIHGIKAAVTIPVMAKARIGHFAEAQVLEALEIDYVDESEVLTPADEPTTSTSTTSRSRSSAARATSARRCAGSARARR